MDSGTLTFEVLHLSSDTDTAKKPYNINSYNLFPEQLTVYSITINNSRPTPSPHFSLKTIESRAYTQTLYDIPRIFRESCAKNLSHCSGIQIPSNSARARTVRYTHAAARGRNDPRARYMPPPPPTSRSERTDDAAFARGSVNAKPP